MRTISWLDLATIVNAIGCGLVGGILFAFSTFIMKALGALPPPHGIAAMQSINLATINPWFLLPFLGVGATCLWTIVAALLRWDDPAAPYWLAGGLLYLVGTILVTMVCNVPQNNALAAADASGTQAAQLWATYLSSWTNWNHVRTIAALLAAVLFTIGFRLRG